MTEKPSPTKFQFLIEAERSRPEAPAEAQAQARAQLAALLGPAAGLGGHGQSAAPHAGHTASSSGGNAAPGAVTQLARGAQTLTAAKVVGVFALGGIVAGGAATALVRPEVRVVYVDRPVPAVSVSASAPTSPSTSTSASAAAEIPLRSAAPLAPPSSGSAAASTTASAPQHDADLAAERGILERARSALARGDAAGALNASNDHARQFPRGQLSEEREVLAVQALAALGRSQEASDRAARFRRSFPKSLLLPVVDAALH